MEVGQQPCLWSSLKLKFRLDNREQTGPMDLPTIGRTNDLLKVLNMGRLQALEQFTLVVEVGDSDLMDSGISWQEFIHFLQITPPSVQKLYLLNFSPTPPEPMPPLNLLAEELMANLVKFEEVDFGTEGFLRGGLANEVLKAVSTVGEDSKLRVLSIPGFERDADTRDALAEARKILTVNLTDGLRVRVYVMPDDDGEDEDADEVAKKNQEWGSLLILEKGDIVNLLFGPKLGRICVSPPNPTSLCKIYQIY